MIGVLWIQVCTRWLSDSQRHDTALTLSLHHLSVSHILLWITCSGSQVMSYSYVTLERDIVNSFYVANTAKILCL